MEGVARGERERAKPGIDQLGNGKQRRGSSAQRTKLQNIDHAQLLAKQISAYEQWRNSAQSRNEAQRVGQRWQVHTTEHTDREKGKQLDTSGSAPLRMSVAGQARAGHAEGKEEAPMRTLQGHSQTGFSAKRRPMQRVKLGS